MKNLISWTLLTIAVVTMVTTTHILVVMTTANLASSYTQPRTTSANNTKTAPLTLHRHFSDSVNMVNTSLNQATPGEHFTIYVTGDPDIKCARMTDLVIVVCSAIQNVRSRDSLRHTWIAEAKAAHPRVRVVFLLGTAPNNDSLQQVITAEHQTHGDILQANIPDKYRNLSHKSVAMLDWVHRFCSTAKFLLKTDDDTWVNIPKLLTSLDHVTYSYFIMGDVIAGAQPMRDKHSKFYTSLTTYPQARYPDYVSGSAYVMSRDLVQDLLNVTRNTPLFWLEDVYITGIAANKLKAKLVHHSKFKSFVITDDVCMLRHYVTVHKMRSDVMLKMSNTECDMKKS